VAEGNHPFIDDEAEPVPETGPITALRPYEFAEFNARAGDPHTLSSGMLAEIVEQIVKVEQPIHEEEVARRLAHVCGLQRAGRRIQEAATRGLEYARRQNRLDVQKRFWSENPDVEVEPRSRAQIATAEMVRKPEMISGAELAAAATVALRHNLALEHDELVTETARLIGLARVGESVREAIERAIRDFLSERIECDHLRRYRLKND
jgi:hypothetical protein